VERSKPSRWLFPFNRRRISKSKLNHTVSVWFTRRSWCGCGWIAYGVLGAGPRGTFWAQVKFFILGVYLVTNVFRSEFQLKWPFFILSLTNSWFWEALSSVEFSSCDLVLFLRFAAVFLCLNSEQLLNSTIHPPHTHEYPGSWCGTWVGDSDSGWWRWVMTVGDDSGYGSGWWQWVMTVGDDSGWWQWVWWQWVWWQWVMTVGDDCGWWQWVTTVGDDKCATVGDGGWQWMTWMTVGDDRGT
jgi:hypothetical protein